MYLKSLRIKSLRTKLLLALLATTAIPLLLLGFFSVWHTTKSLASTLLQAGRNDLRTRKAQMEAFFTSVTQDTLFLSKVSPVQGIIRAQANNGQDQQTQSTYEQWVDRLNTIFLGLIEARPAYQQIRYLNAQGQELVRVDGSQMVNASGQALDDIMIAIKKMSDLITEISAASQEQATGIV
jgi:methyl-accepting chemotaxis protein